AVRKTVSGLLKLLHPHGEWSRADLREYLELALEGRRRVKEQLRKLAPHDYAKTAFSYSERDTGREYWVEVPENPDQVELEIRTEAVAVASGDKKQSRRTTADLLASREGSSTEFK